MHERKYFFKKKRENRNKHFKLTLLIIFGILLLMALTFKPPALFRSERMESFHSPITISESPNSKPLLILHHATIINEYLTQFIPKNVSFALVEGWISKNTTIYYEGISYMKDWVINGDFNSSLEPWENLTTNVNIDIMGWNPSGYVSVRIPGSTQVAENDYTYYFQNFSIPELFAPGKLVSLSMDYLYDTGPQIPSNLQAYMAIAIGGIEKNYTIDFPNLVKDSWTGMTLTYDPINFGQEIPDFLTLKVGVRGNNTAIVTNNQELFIDNVELKMWTQPNQSQIIYAMDCETGFNYTLQNSSFGMGESFIGVEKNYTDTTNVIFTIFSNITNVLEMEIHNITIASNAVKPYNSSVDGVSGCNYLTNGLIKWQTEWDITIPSTYLNSWIEIEKPVDWNITLILDGYDTDQTGECSGIGFGSSRVFVPTAFVGSGLWTIEAESYNYVTDGYISRWNGTGFENQTNMYVGDKFQISVVLNNTLSLNNTQINCTIKYPNNTIFLQESYEPSSPIITFGNYTAGLDMTIGKYQVYVEWVNNLSVLERDKIGFIGLEFTMIHRTNLSAVESYIEEVAGVPTLVKVKFIDFDLNTTIALAEVTYNSTYGASGLMAYIGSGIYMAELNTATLPVGDYYLSFNACKVFYQNNSVANLIHLKIRAESLVLDVPRQVKTAMANSYISYKINLTGEVSGLFLSGANITLDWYRNYTISDYENGTYGLNLSTFEATTGAVPETYTITISANKTNFGSTSDVILLTIYPIPAQVGLNSTLVQVAYGFQFSIRANYTVVATNASISGANCNVTWSDFYTISPIGADFIITFNTSGLSNDIYTILIQLSHPGYKTILESILVTITPIPTEIGLNKTLVSVSLNDGFSIRANYTVQGSNASIGSANCNVTWDGSYNIAPVGDEFIITFNTSGLSVGVYIALIQISRSGYETALGNVFVSISPIPSEMHVNATLVTATLGELFYIKVNYTREGTSNLISGANCTVVWDDSNTITPAGDEFIIAFNTSGLSVDVFTALIQMTHPYYETAAKSIIVTINPIPAQIKTNASLVSVTLGAVFYIAANYTVESSNQSIAGANCVVTWGRIYNISLLGDDYIIAFNTTGLNVSVYTALIQISHPDYETAAKSIIVTINPIPAQIKTNASLVSVTLGAVFYIAANYTVESSNQSIAGANCVVTWGGIYNISLLGDDYIIAFNTTGLNVSVYTALIQISHPDYETALKTIFVTTNPIPAQIGVNSTLVEISLDKTFYLRVNYTEEQTGDLISSATCNVTWDSSYIISPMGDEFLILFNTSGLSVEVYTILLQLSHPNYETEFKNIFVIIYPISAQIDVNSTLLTIPLGYQFYIKANYTIEGSNELISGANCTVTWGSYYNITTIGDQFLITFNTTGLSSDIYTVFIQMNHPNYETALKTILVSITPIPAQVGVNVTLVNVDYGDSFYVRVNYTVVPAGTLIANASCTVSWGAAYNITQVGNEFIIRFNTTGLVIDVYTALIQVEHPSYSTALKVINVIVKPIDSDLKILNEVPREFIRGDLVNLTCEFLAKDQPVLNANLTLIGEITGDFKWNGSLYYLTINTTALQAKTYFTQIMGEKENIEIRIIENIFAILPLSLEILLNTTTITYQEGQINNVYLSIFDNSHNTSRTDLRVTYSYGSQSGNLNLQPNGSFLLSLNALNLPPSAIPYQIKIIVHNPYGTDAELTLNVIVPIEEPDYSLIIWILAGAVVAVSGALLGVYIKNKYFKFTKFQREIQKLKNQLLKKGRFDAIKTPDRAESIQELLDKEFSISGINHKEVK